MDLYLPSFWNCAGSWESYFTECKEDKWSGSTLPRRGRVAKIRRGSLKDPVGGNHCASPSEQGSIVWSAHASCPGTEPCACCWTERDCAMRAKTETPADPDVILGNENKVHFFSWWQIVVIWKEAWVLFWVLLYTTHGCIFWCEADDLFSDDFTALAAGYEHNCLYLLHKHTVVNPMLLQGLIFRTQLIRKASAQVTLT